MSIKTQFLSNIHNTYILRSNSNTLYLHFAEINVEIVYVAFLTPNTPLYLLIRICLRFVISMMKQNQNLYREACFLDNENMWACQLIFNVYITEKTLDYLPERFAAGDEKSSG